VLGAAEGTADDEPGGDRNSGCAGRARHN
jgi:hypothetical protein